MIPGEDHRANKAQCPLCHSHSQHFTYITCNNRIYVHCHICDLHFLVPANHLTHHDEKSHYLHHHNDIDDPRYQRFVQPLLEKITSLAPPEASGLDYGCGPGPVTTYLLKQKGWNITLYDPYFHPESTALQTSYDFVFCCEVVEHFNQPREEFRRLYNLLKPGGFLAMMTSQYNGTIDFKTWSYTIDPTHVSFYSSTCLEFIAKDIGFTNLWSDGQKIAVLFK